MIKSSGMALRTDIIDVHAHFLPPVYRAALADGGHATLDGGMPIPDWSVAMAIDVMDRHGVARSLLSVSSPGLTVFDSATGIALARDINETAARIIADHPGRFGALATLPMGDPVACVAEIDHALDVLGLDGFIVESNHHGTYPGDPSWQPVLAALDARAALVLLHPTSPSCQHCIAQGRPAPMIEFPFETTRAAVDLIYSGTLARYPNIRFVLPHGGGTLPWLAQRITGFAAVPGPWSAQVSPPDVARGIGHFFYDTALAATPGQIAMLKQLAGVDRILFGSDWPFSPDVMLGGGIAALTGMDVLDDAGRAAIFGGNARRLLGEAAQG